MHFSFLVGQKEGGVEYVTRKVTVDLRNDLDWLGQRKVLTKRRNVL